MTFTEYAQLSRKLEENDGNQPDYEKIERDYWDYVENQTGPEVKVQYAADLPVHTFGSAFGREN